MTRHQRRPRDPELWVLGNFTLDDLVWPDGTTAMGRCGGNAVFAALGARLWAAGVGIAARLGPDYPAAYLRALERAGIVLALCRVAAPSLHNWALYESPDTRRFVPWVGSGTHLDQSILPEELPAAIATAAGCHIAPMPLVVQRRLVGALSRPGLITALDPHEEYIPSHEAELVALLARVTLFLPSRREAALLFGRDDPEAALRSFAAAGPRVVAVKLGAEGSVVCDAAAGLMRHIPALPVAARDPTGAGDAYCGGFLAAYCHGADPFVAACHATVSASFVVERCGALDLLPLDRLEAGRRLARLRARLGLAPVRRISGPTPGLSSAS